MTESEYGISIHQQVQHNGGWMVYVPISLSVFSFGPMGLKLLLDLIGGEYVKSVGRRMCLGGPNIAYKLRDKKL